MKNTKKLREKNQKKSEMVLTLGNDVEGTVFQGPVHISK